MVLYFVVSFMDWLDLWWTPVPTQGPATGIGLFELFRLSPDQAHGYLRHANGLTAMSFTPGAIEFAPIVTGNIYSIELLEGGAYFLGHIDGQAPYIAAGFGTLGPFEPIDNVGLGSGTFQNVAAVLDDGVHAAFAYQLGGNLFDTELVRFEGGVLVDQRPFALARSSFFWWTQRGSFVYAITPLPDFSSYQIWGIDLNGDQPAQPMSPGYEYDGLDPHYSVAGNWFMYPSDEHWYLVESIAPGIGTIVEWGGVEPGNYGHRAVPRLGG